MSTPFFLHDQDSYQRWRDHKLANAITRTEELIVEINDPYAPTPAEREALLARCRRSNMVIYASPRHEDDEQMVRALGRQFGLESLDANWLADDQGITRITVCANDGQRQSYIPYTNHAIKWHTDGYYNTPPRMIRAMVLHCVHSAGEGGDNRLMDHEMAYLLLREANPDYIHALMQPDAMTIPERTDEHGVARAAQAGPVFIIDPYTHDLNMRYTARTRSIVWHDDPLTRAAVKALEELLASDSPHIHHARLESGMGVLCNNVLHDRTAFVDGSDHQRLLYRARYHDRIALG